MKTEGCSFYSGASRSTVNFLCPIAGHLVNHAALSFATASRKQRDIRLSYAESLSRHGYVC